MERGVTDTVPAKMTSVFLVAESHRQEHTLPQVVTTKQGPRAFSTSPGASHGGSAYWHSGSAVCQRGMTAVCRPRMTLFTGDTALLLPSLSGASCFSDRRIITHVAVPASDTS